jgi:hypothetical protein
MNTRWLGTLSIIGGVAYFVMAIYSAIVRRPEDQFNLVGQSLGLIWALGAICGWLGFVLVRGTGNNVVVRFLSYVPIVGLAIVAMMGMLALVSGKAAMDLPITGFGLILELVGIVLVTIFALATRALPGWKKFTPLFVVLGIVVGGVIGGATSGAVYGIPLCHGITYSILGYAVRTANASPRLVSQSA